MKSARTRANWSYVGLGLCVAAAAFSIVVTLQEIELLHAFDGGEYVSLSEADASDARVASAGLLSSASIVAAAIAFCLWIHRASWNLRALTQGPVRFSPGWSVGCFFVPIVNLFRPYQVMNEIYRVSHGRQSGSPLLGIWWASWLVGGYLGWTATRLFFQEPDIAAAITADWLIIISDIALVLAAVATIVLIRRVTLWQDARGGRVGKEPHQVPDPSRVGHPPTAHSPRGGVAERLRELHRLRDEGLISDEQFEQSRSRIVGEL